MRAALLMASLLALALVACVGSPLRDADSASGAELPVVCTLTPDELASGRDALLPGLIARAERVTDLENGLRLSFASRPGLLSELAGLMEQERGCCRFLRFQLTAEPADGTIVLEVTGPPGTREALRAL